MRVHEFVEGNKPVMVLVHGVLTPWHIWKPHIDAFKDKQVRMITTDLWSFITYLKM